MSYNDVIDLQCTSPNVNTNTDRYMPSAGTGSGAWKTNVVGKQQDQRVQQATREHLNVDQLWTLKNLWGVVLCSCCQKPMMVYSPLLSVQGGEAQLPSLDVELHNYLDIFRPIHGAPLVGHKTGLAQVFYCRQANACATRIEPHYYSSSMDNVGLCVWCGRSSEACDLEESGRAEDGKRYYPQCAGASIDVSLNVACSTRVVHMCTQNMICEPHVSECVDNDSGLVTGCFEAGYKASIWSRSKTNYVMASTARRGLPKQSEVRARQNQTGGTERKTKCVSPAASAQTKDLVGGQVHHAPTVTPPVGCGSIAVLLLSEYAHSTVNALQQLLCANNVYIHGTGAEVNVPTDKAGSPWPEKAGSPLDVHKVFMRLTNAQTAGSCGHVAFQEVMRLEKEWDKVHKDSTNPSEADQHNVLRSAVLGCKAAYTATFRAQALTADAEHGAVQHVLRRLHREPTNLGDPVEWLRTGELHALFYGGTCVPHGQPQPVAGPRSRAQSPWTVEPCLGPSRRLQGRGDKCVFLLDSPTGLSRSDVAQGGHMAQARRIIARVGLEVQNRDVTKASLLHFVVHCGLDCRHWVLVSVASIPRKPKVETATKGKEAKKAKKAKNGKKAKKAKVKKAKKAKTKTPKQCAADEWLQDLDSTDEEDQRRVGVAAGTARAQSKDDESTDARAKGATGSAKGGIRKANGAPAKKAKLHKTVQDPLQCMPSTGEEDQGRVAAGTAGGEAEKKESTGAPVKARVHAEAAAAAEASAVMAAAAPGAAQRQVSLDAAQAQAKAQAQARAQSKDDESTDARAKGATGSAKGGIRKANGAPGKKAKLHKTVHEPLHYVPSTGEEDQGRVAADTARAQYRDNGSTDARAKRATASANGGVPKANGAPAKIAPAPAKSAAKERKRRIVSTATRPQAAGTTPGRPSNTHRTAYEASTLRVSAGRLYKKRNRGDAAGARTVCPQGACGEKVLPYCVCQEGARPMQAPAKARPPPPPSPFPRPVPLGAVMRQMMQTCFGERPPSTMHTCAHDVTLFGSRWARTWVSGKGGATSV